MELKQEMNRFQNGNLKVILFKFINYLSVNKQFIMLQTHTGLTSIIKDERLGGIILESRTFFENTIL